jgi:multiple antibiotic resistance protein
MLAGPGAMSSVSVLITQNPDWAHRGIVLGAVATASLVSFLVLAAADRVSAYLHETGIRILTRLMGLLLTAIAVQFVLNGLRDVGVVR